MENGAGVTTQAARPGPLLVFVGVLLCLALGAAGWKTYSAFSAARERDRAAEVEALALTATVGGGAALDQALLGRVRTNFTLALLDSQQQYDLAAAALTNPPVLDMALVKNRADLQARAEAVRRLIKAARDMREFAENTPEIYRRELEKHKLPPQAREADLKRFAAEIAAVNPTIIALRRAQVRRAEALLRLVLLLDGAWGRWDYRPAQQDLSFKQAKDMDAYNMTYEEFNALSKEAQSLKDQLKTRTP